MPKPDGSHRIFDTKTSRVRPGTCALAVMTKAPLAGSSKTRLTPPLTAHEAAGLSACFLRDTCDNIAEIGADGKTHGVAVYTPIGTERVFTDLLPASFSLLSQRGNSFGERLFHATEDLLALGYDSLCLIDSDSPTLPPAFLRAAVAALARSGDRIVLGAAEDGGYYLIGLKKAHRRVFENIDWSTSNVLAQTITRAGEIGIPATVLPEWFDVDDAATLRQLCQDLFGRYDEPNSQFGPAAYPAPRTRDFLAALLQADQGQRRIWEPIIGFTSAAATGSGGCDFTTE